MQKVFIDPEFQVEQRTIEDDVADARYQEISRSDDRVVFEVHTDEYVRGMRGVERSKTEEWINKIQWDLGTHSCRWQLQTPHGDRVKVNGSQRIEAAGDRAQFTATYDVSVKVPLIGGKIEKMVIKQIEQQYGAFENLARRYCEKLG